MTADLSKPGKYYPVRELVQQAGIDVSDWAIDRDGNEIQNPNENVHKSNKWSFGGSGQPIALCIWYEHIDNSQNPPVLEGNMKAEQAEMDALASKATSKGMRQRLSIKNKRAGEFQKAIFEAFQKRLAVRFILLTGTKTELDEADKKSSKVNFRELDDAPWFVHSYDPFTGAYRFVRNLEIPQQSLNQSIDVLDPILDPNFQKLIAPLSDTERDALIKTRVGQGPFRDALIQRWKSCSVTGCGAIDLLIASHIKPWSKCLNSDERTGAANGLLLTPNLDKLFDRGFITFDQNFKILISPQLKLGTCVQLNINVNIRLRSQEYKDMLPFLAWHSDNVFRQ